MEKVTFLGIKKWYQHKSVQQSHGPVQYKVSAEYNLFSVIIFLAVALRPNAGHGLLILEVF